MLQWRNLWRWQHWFCTSKFGRTGGRITKGCMGPPWTSEFRRVKASNRSSQSWGQWRIKGIFFLEWKDWSFLIDLIWRYRKEKPSENVKSFELIQILYEGFSILWAVVKPKTFVFHPWGDKSHPSTVRKRKYILKLRN